MTRTTPERPVDIEALFPELSAYRRTGTRLHPRPGDPTAEHSSVGGPLLWPADEPWPVCEQPHPRDTGLRPADVHRKRRILAETWSRPADSSAGRGPTDAEREQISVLEATHHVPGLSETSPVPLVPVAQLFTREVPGLQGPAGRDLLQVLWCPFDAHGEGGHDLLVCLYWRTAAEVTDRLTIPPLPEVVGFQGYVPEPCVLHPEQVVEHPFVDVLPQGLRDRIDAWDEEQEEEDEEDAIAYQYDLSIPPGCKVGGYASWHLTGPTEIRCDCGHLMEPLLTIDSKEWDNGSRSWVPLEDRPTMDAMDANIPTQITVGRWGSLRIFTCPADPTHPHRLNVQ